MKTEKYILTGLCIVACLWVGWRIAGAAGLAYRQGPAPGPAYLEVLAFTTAAAVPLATTWWRAARKSWLRACWAVSILYVCFLAANYTWHDPIGGSMRLLLWAAIVTLAFRQSQREEPR